MLVLDPGIRWFGFPGQAYGKPDGAAGIPGEISVMRTQAKMCLAPLCASAKKKILWFIEEKRLAFFRPSTLSN